MTKKSKSGLFSAENGEENSITITRVSGVPMVIGFVSADADFFLDTESNQVKIHPEHLNELIQFITSIQNELS